MSVCVCVCVFFHITGILYILKLVGKITNFLVHLVNRLDLLSIQELTFGLYSGYCGMWCWY